jgi:hypothetical protein
MAENKVIIDVEVQGVQDAQKNLQKIEVSATEIGSSVKGVGESFKGVGAVVSAQGGVMGEAFNSLGESVGGLVDGFGAMSEVMTAGGKSGMLAFMGMLGPISAIAGALALAIEAFRQFSGAAKEAEQIEAAVTAAASDLTSKMEELADKGIRPTNDELRKLIGLNSEARLKLEVLNEKNASLTKVYTEQILAQKELERQQKKYLAQTNERVRTDGFVISAQMNLEEANKAVAKAQEELTKGYETALPAIQKAQEYQRELAMTEQEAMDALKAQLEIQKEYNDLLLSTSTLSAYEKSILQKERDLSVEQRLAGQHGKTSKEIQALTKVIEEENKARQAGETLQLKEIKNQQEIEQIKKAEADRLKAEQKARSDAFKARQMQVISEQSQINALEIQLTKSGFDEQMALAENNYKTAQMLNKNNKNQLLIAEKQYQLAIRDINGQQLAQEQAKIAEQERINQELISQRNAYSEAVYQSMVAYGAKEQELRDKIAILDIEAGKDEYQKQLDLLAKNQEIELRSVENNELAKAEIQKRYANQRVKVESYAASQMGEMAKSTTQAFAASVAGAIMGAQSMQEAIKATLEGLAQEAITRSIFATAMGFSALALGPIGGVSASQYFKSAALFAGVGAVAGVSSKAMGGGGSGGGSASSVSPTGLAQSQAPSRPEASKTEPMIFNINLGGSVIYDTKAAAERAFADKIVRTINNGGRGMVRLNA